jgi:MATE family multidrug resistance protein
MLLVCATSVAEATDPRDRRPSRAALGQVLRLGWPIGFQFTAEVGVFSAVSTLIALEGPVALAGHQIALNLASLTFMAAVGIAVGATARVGHHVGGGRAGHARVVGLVAIGLGAAFMAAGGLVFWTVPEVLAGWFAPESAEVRRAAATFLGIAAVFAISDGVQAVGAGALRGAGETRSALVANLFGHGAVGLPVGLFLGRGLAWGGVGYWWGLTAGLTATAVLLVARLLVLTARPIARAESRPAPV